MFNESLESFSNWFVIIAGFSYNGKLKVQDSAEKMF